MFRKIIGRIVEVIVVFYGCLAIFLCFVLGIAGCLSFFMPIKVVGFGTDLIMVFFSSLFLLLVGGTISTWLIAGLLRISAKQLFGLLVHKLLDWRVIRNPLTSKWYPELYKKE